MIMTPGGFENFFVEVGARTELSPAAIVKIETSCRIIKNGLADLFVRGPAG